MKGLLHGYAAAHVLDKNSMSTGLHNKSDQAFLSRQVIFQTLFVSLRSSRRGAAKIKDQSNSGLNA